MAEGLAIAAGKRTGRTVGARSASTLGLVDRPADPHAVAVCQEIGVDIASHKSRPVFAEDVEWADYILVMALHHASAVRDQFPEADHKVLLLGTLGGALEIADPIGKGRSRFRSARDEIKRCVDAFNARLPTA
ncbi:MAG: protein-tyrosine phosphatase [Myxococcota bacterium]|jgi:protein-tyrosine phosphatase